MHSSSSTPRAELFLPGAITPEVAAFNARMEAVLEGKPGLWEIGLEAGRRGGFMPISPPSPRSHDRDIGATRLHIIPTDNAKALYLHMHGGGMVLGAANGQDPMLERLGDRLGVTCVSVDYRLAPENPYPAAWDDCEAAAVWLIKNAKAEFGTDRILIGGDSAGALLAVATLMRLRDKHGYEGIEAANLIFGCFDTSMTPSQRRADKGILTAREISRCAAAYCPDPAQARNPDVSPLYGDLSHMPPALFTVGTLDPFLDDSMFMYCRWISARARAGIAVWPGAGHGFIGSPHPLAREADDNIEAFLASIVELAGGSDLT